MKSRNSKNAKVEEYENSLDVAGSFAMADLLTQFGATSQDDQWKAKVYLNAAHKHNLDDIERALEEEKVSVDAQDNFQNTALHRALEGTDNNSEERTLRTIDLLLKFKISLNHQNQRGRTALFVASQKNKKLSAKKLLDEGAVWDLKDTKGETVIDVAATLEIRNIIKGVKHNLEGES